MLTFMEFHKCFMEFHQSFMEFHKSFKEFHEYHLFTEFHKSFLEFHKCEHLWNSINGLWNSINELWNSINDLWNSINKLWNSINDLWNSINAYFRALRLAILWCLPRGCLCTLRCPQPKLRFPQLMYVRLTAECDKAVTHIFNRFRLVLARPCSRPRLLAIEAAGEEDLSLTLAWAFLALFATSQANLFLHFCIQRSNPIWVCSDQDLHVPQYFFPLYTHRSRYA